MPILLPPLTPEASPAQKAVINVIVVCSTFFVLGYFVVFSEPDLFLEQATFLDYVVVMEPFLSLLAIVQGVRIGWLDWKKDQYDRMKFPLSGVELLTFVGFVSGFCLVQLLALPIHPVVGGVNWTAYAVICVIVLPGLIWTSQQDMIASGGTSIWSAILRALMLIAIAAEIFLSLNLLSAQKTDEMVLRYIQSKYSTTSARSISHHYHVNVTSPTDPIDIVSLTIDHSSWERIREGDAVKFRLFRGGLQQDYWRYEP
jgi:hypothetical protein